MNADLSWHDQDSPKAVRYLGYPLYHNRAQIPSFLDNIKQKILRHAQFYHGRHLSIRGTSLIANSLLLSRLWHVLRVIVPPDSWLRSIRRIVKEFVAPFAFAPSWDRLCHPRKHGGAGLVNLHTQSLALQLIYIQRLLLPGTTDTDFVTPWLAKGLHLYTGHVSLLPWFMYPKQFNYSNKPIIQFIQLAKLLSRLPALRPHPSWSGRWYLDLSLKAILQQNPDYPDQPPPLNFKTFSRRLLISDMFTWLPNTGTLQLKVSLRLPRLQALQPALFPFFDDEPATLLLPPEIYTLFDSSSSSSFAPVCGSFISWLPPTAHWTIPCGPKHTVAIVDLSLSDFRKFWYPLLPLFAPPRLPPLWAPAFARMRSFCWRFFWNLPMTAKAFTPWWRLLTGTINTKYRLYRLHSGVEIDPTVRTVAPQLRMTFTCLLIAQLYGTFGLDFSQSWIF